MYVLTRIIQSLYYAPAGRYISADRGRSIRVMYVRGYLQGSENDRVVIGKVSKNRASGSIVTTRPFSLRLV